MVSGSCLAAALKTLVPIGVGLPGFGELRRRTPSAQSSAERREGGSAALTCQRWRSVAGFRIRRTVHGLHRRPAGGSVPGDDGRRARGRTQHHCRLPRRPRPPSRPSRPPGASVRRAASEATLQGYMQLAARRRVRPDGGAAAVLPTRLLHRFLIGDGARPDDPDPCGWTRRACPPALPQATWRRRRSMRCWPPASARPGVPGLLGRAALEIALLRPGLRVSELLGLPRAALGDGVGDADRARQGRARSAWCCCPASARDRGGGADRAPRRHGPPGCSPGATRAMPMTRQGFALHAEAGVALAAKPRPRPRQPACAAPQLRQPHAGRRRRLAQPANCCLATPTSPPRRSTPMCWRSGCMQLVALHHPLSAVALVKRARPG